MGYLWDEERTGAALTDDLEWYMSGDVAKLVEGGKVSMGPNNN